MKNTYANDAYTTIAVDNATLELEESEIKEKKSPFMSSEIWRWVGIMLAIALARALFR